MPKIIGAHLAEHRTLTRKRLFNALAELLTEQAFSDITMSQIAERAHVGRTAIYNHFADKDAILLAYMRQTTAEFADFLEQALEDQADPLEQLRIYVRAYMELKEHFHLPQATDLRSHVSRESAEHLHDHATIVEHVLSHMLQSAMSTGRIPQQNVRLLVALVHASMSGVALPADQVGREDAIRRVQAFILRAVGVRADQVPLPPADLSDEAPAADAEAFLRCPVVH